MVTLTHLTFVGSRILTFTFHFFKVRLTGSVNCVFEVELCCAIYVFMNWIYDCIYLHGKCKYD